MPRPLAGAAEHHRLRRVHERWEQGAQAAGFNEAVSGEQPIGPPGVAGPQGPPIDVTIAVLDGGTFN